MRSVIHQPEFFPWTNFFYKVKKANSLIFLDNVQYNRRSFQNRNYIKASNGQIFLTVPIKKSSRDSLINEIEVDNTKNWVEEHLALLNHNYKKAKYFIPVYEFLEKIYLQKKWKYLYEFNMTSIKEIIKILKIKTNFFLSSEYILKEKKSDLIFTLCKKTNTNHYITGVGSLDYLKKNKFEEDKILIEFLKPKKFIYTQTFPKLNFLNHLSILDYLFNCGYEKFPNCDVKN